MRMKTSHIRCWQWQQCLLRRGGLDPASRRARAESRTKSDARGQRGQSQSAILQQAIEGLGGAAYLNVHNSDCSGRYRAVSAFR